MITRKKEVMRQETIRREEKKRQSVVQKILSQTP
jgi:hypothetical protein